jgi:hypothetical protein
MLFVAVSKRGNYAVNYSYFFLAPLQIILFFLDQSVIFVFKKEINFIKTNFMALCAAYWFMDSQFAGSNLPAAGVVKMTIKTIFTTRQL